MDKVYRVVIDRCVACGKCELACSFVHGGMAGVAKSRIHIRRTGPERGIPVVCLQCEDAACKAACPVEAIDWNAATGALEVNDARCVRCRMCVAACPFGNMSWDEGFDRVSKCDLCGGDPKCVPFCPTQALDYVPADRAGKTPPRLTTLETSI